MNELSDIKSQIFEVSTEQEFNDLCLKIFRLQYANNDIYMQFVDFLGKTPGSVKQYSDIPFLPIEFFRNYRILSGNAESPLEFKSSGTTGMHPSSHLVADPGIYEKSFLLNFNQHYGEPGQYAIMALLPSYLGREDSSLIYMVRELIRQSGDRRSGFYLNDLEALSENVHHCIAEQKQVLLIGVSFALLDLAESFPQDLKHAIVMETGGMKGRRKEMLREELHEILCRSFGIDHVHSEYGMTELLSQAYAKSHGLFRSPPWMKVMIRDINDPLSYVGEGKTGGINVIDLANIYSCSFIATQDLGRMQADGQFEVLGRFDNSEVRGCNLMVS